MEENNCCSCSIGGRGVSDKFITVTPKVFAEEILEPDVYLVDVRTADEFATGHIKGAHNLDVNSDDFIEEAKKTLPKDKRIAVNCGTGRRSAKAAGELVEAGFKVINLDGGLDAWKAAGLSLEE